MTIAFLTAAGEAVRLCCRNRAATPVTCGVAIDVPLIVLVAVLLVDHADVMLEPGAKMSTTLPKFEKDDRASLIVVAPTVMAVLTRAGEKPLASAFELPAAIAYVTPDPIELRTAVSSADETPPPRLMLATAGPMWCPVTQSTPAITPDVVPDPEQLSTRTAKRRTAFATP